MWILLLLNDGLTAPLYSSITNSGDEIQILAQQIIQTKRKDTLLIKSADLKIFSENRPECFFHLIMGYSTKMKKT